MTDHSEREIVTQEDVAKQAGVSRAIVSYVLNNGPRKVSEATRERVLRAIQELGYRPNLHAQRLKLGAEAAQNSIGVVIGGKGYNVLERSYYSVILAGLFDSAQQLNQHIRFFTFFDGLKDPVFFNKNIHREEVSSLILMLPQLILADPEHEPIMRQIIERISNIICMESSIFNLPALVVDLAAAAQMVVEHLISLGHRRIGFLALPDQRSVGYKRALIMHDIAFEPALVRTIDTTRWLPSAYDLTLDLIESHPDVTAIFAVNDEAAIAAMAALHDHGLNVPDDVAVVSIDNVEIAGIVRPALTTISVPQREMPEYALRFLLSQRDNPMRPAASMVLPMELIVRESCGARKRQPG